MGIVTLCGSLKFQKEMMETAEELALKGYCVLTPVYPVLKDIKINKKQISYMKESHFKRIELADTIVVINVDNYIGDSTKKEIEYANKLNKNIIYYTDLICDKIKL